MFTCEKKVSAWELVELIDNNKKPILLVTNELADAVDKKESRGTVTEGMLARVLMCYPMGEVAILRLNTDGFEMFNKKYVAENETAGEFDITVDLWRVNDDQLFSVLLVDNVDLFSRWLEEWISGKTDLDYSSWLNSRVSEAWEEIEDIADIEEAMKAENVL